MENTPIGSVVIEEASTSAGEAWQKPARRWSEAVLEFCRVNWQAQGAFLLVAATIVLLRLVLLPGSASGLVETFHGSLRPIVAAIAIAICGYLFLKTIRTRSLSASFTYLWSDIFTRRNAVTAIPAFLAAGLVMNSFTFFKAQIPEFQPYELDVWFAELDRVLHFGVDPWRLTEAWFGYGLVTRLLDQLYYLWFFAVYISLVICIGMPSRSPFRHRFLLCYVFVWAVLGIACATALSSVGPIYFDRVYGGPSQFTELVQHLAELSAQSGLNTMLVREMLWIAYATDANGTISGISAMPSIHNAMCVFLVLAARHIDSRLAIAAAVYMVVIFVASVHLAWHYAIDGYASAIGVLLLWKLAGFLTANGKQGLLRRPAA